MPHLIAAMPSAPLHAAVCLTGAVRSLASTAFPLQRAILDAWDADLFVVLHTDGSHGSERHGWVNGSSTGTSSTGTPASAEDAHRVLGTLRPKAGWLDDFGGRRKYGFSSNMPSQPPKQRSSLNNSKCSAWVHPLRRANQGGLSIDYHVHPVNCAPQLRNHRQCAELVRLAEQRYSLRYDWILSTRPDLLWRSVPPLLSFPNSTVWALRYDGSNALPSTGSKDFAQLVPRHLLHEALERPDDLKTCTHEHRRWLDDMMSRQSEADLELRERRVCGQPPFGGCECMVAKSFAWWHVPLGWFDANTTLCRESPCA